MSAELFRFVVVRPAAPLVHAPTIQLAPGDGGAASEFDDKTLEAWIQRLAELARAGRDDDSALDEAVRATDEINLQAIRPLLHRRLLEHMNDPQQLELADAVRGLEMAQLAPQSDAAVLAATARAMLSRGASVSAQRYASTAIVPLSFLIDGQATIQPRPQAQSQPPRQPKPAGVAELQLVRQQVLRYEAGEIAHIENVLAGESHHRKHRQLDRTEDVSILDQETTRQQSRDLQSTERFELAAESQKQIEQRNQWDVGMTMSASYGPMVQVGLSASAGGSSVREQSDRRATAFSREVTEQAASAVTERIRREHQRTVLSEVKETNRHAIDNSGSDKHVIGVYQWVDKIVQAQVFSYGKRLMYDLILPEPGAFLAFAQQRAASADASAPQPPTPWELQPGLLTVDNWLDWAARYQAKDVTPPPMPITRSAHTKIQPGEESAPFTYTAVIGPPDGYRAVAARIAAEVAKAAPKGPSDLYPTLLVSVAGVEHSFDNLGEVRVANLPGNEVRIDMASRDPRTVALTLRNLPPGEVPVGIAAGGITAAAVTVAVDLEPTPARLQQWRHEACTQIRQAYEAMLAAHLARQAQAEVNAGVAISGRAPAESRRLERDEIRKQAISAFTRQHFDGFDAMGKDVELGFPELDLGRYEAQGQIVRFFEQAFEWQQASWVLYPYYWSRKENWLERINLEGADSQHVAFLRAGAARVQVPVRPGFESALLHYQATGEIWQGTQPPQVHDEAYLPILEELAEQLQRPDATEQPVGEPWELRLPTDLVRLNPIGELPRWVQDDEGRWHTQPDDHE